MWHLLCIFLISEIILCLWRLFHISVSVVFPSLYDSAPRISFSQYGHYRNIYVGNMGMDVLR